MMHLLLFALLFSSFSIAVKSKWVVITMLVICIFFISREPLFRKYSKSTIRIGVSVAISIFLLIIIYWVSLGVYSNRILSGLIDNSTHFPYRSNEYDDIRNRYNQKWEYTVFFAGIKLGKGELYISAPYTKNGLEQNYSKLYLSTSKLISILSNFQQRNYEVVFDSRSYLPFRIFRQDLHRYYYSENAMCREEMRNTLKGEYQNSTSRLPEVYDPISLMLKVSQLRDIATNKIFFINREINNKVKLLKNKDYENIEEFVLIDGDTNKKIAFLKYRKDVFLPVLIKVPVLGENWGAVSVRLITERSILQ